MCRLSLYCVDARWGFARQGSLRTRETAGRQSPACGGGAHLPLGCVGQYTYILTGTVYYFRVLTGSGRFGGPTLARSDQPSFRIVGEPPDDTFFFCQPFPHFRHKCHLPFCFPTEPALFGILISTNRPEIQFHNHARDQSRTDRTQLPLMNAEMRASFQSHQRTLPWVSPEIRACHQSQDRFSVEIRAACPFLAKNYT